MSSCVMGVSLMPPCIPASSRGAAPGWTTLSSMGRLVSLNVGTPAQIAVRRGRALMSAIGKAPVAGRRRVEGVNVAGDAQADRRVHGGPDKAVYAYAAEDVAWWAQQLGRDL